MGESVRRRHAPQDARLALTMFALWWFGLAASTALGGIRGVLAAAGVDNVAVYLTLTHVSLVPLTVALWALLYYLLFLYTGRAGILWPLSVGYALLYLALVGLLVWLSPTGVAIENGVARVEYARSLAGPGLAVLLGAFLGPVVVAAVLYGSLFFRLKDRTQRYRVGLVSSAFLAWFASPIAAIALGASTEAWWVVTSRAIGVLVPLVVLAAFRPPAWIRARLSSTARSAEATLQ